jgi:hypothetical protein
MNPNADLRPLTSDLRPRRSHLGWGIIVFVLIFQFWSRYMPAPMAVFVADDWSNWARSTFYAAHSEAFLAGLKDPNRPLSMAAVELLFRVFDNHAGWWTFISLLGNGLLMLTVIGMAWRLTGRRSVALLAGLFFALFPNLTETYNWSTQVLNEVSCALVFYGLSGWLWIGFATRGGAWRLLASAAAYGVALFSYEAGLLLPTAYLVLLSWRGRVVANGLRLAPIAAVALGYAAWRATNAFGLGAVYFYPPHMQAGIPLGGIVWNVKQLFQWWVGERMLGSMANGLAVFSTLPLETKRFLLVGNVFAVLAATWLVLRVQRRPELIVSGIGASRAGLFALVWTGAASAIPVVSYTAPRLLVLPAMGIALGLALVLDRFPVGRWGLLALIPAILSLGSNQGTAESYRQAHEVNVKLHRHLVETMEQWRDSEVLLLDTTQLRNRLTPGLLASPVSAQDAAAQYRNTLLLRGFVLAGMVRLALHDPDPAIRTVLDVECGARIEGDRLIWHERFDPGQPRITRLDRVHRVDLGEVLWSVSPDRPYR